MATKQGLFLKSEVIFPMVGSRIRCQKAPAMSNLTTKALLHFPNSIPEAVNTKEGFKCKFKCVLCSPASLVPMNGGNPG